jgi:hypothetical protein
MLSARFDICQVLENKPTREGFEIHNEKIYENLAPN